ncbi:putative copper-exporting P-type ATPase A [uncultured archaeon]|nr:putative copper-exporting P-type ATPase A [uncultured archaeon]
MGNEMRVVSDLLRELETDEKNGISQAEAIQRLERDGRNEITPKKTSSAFSSLLAFFKEPMLWLLVGAAAIYFMLGDQFDAWLMLLAAIPIAAIDAVIAYQTENALEKLRQIASPRARVVRGGMEFEADSAEIVRGDVFIVHEGEVIPADAVVLESSYLKVDESALSGESMLVEKERADSFSEEVFNNRNVVFAGTTVLGGHARCVTFKTGLETQYGHIGGMLSRIETAKTPLQKNIDQIITFIGIIAAFLFLFLFSIQIVVAGKQWPAALLDAVSLAIAVIPEEFPVTFALFLSLGAWSLAYVNALVKRMAAVETLGSVSVICSDKTGTLTTGRMTLTNVYYDGYVNSADEFLAHSRTREVLEAAVLACERKPSDPMEKSIFEYAGRFRAPEDMQFKRALEVEYSFDSKNRFVSNVWRYGGKFKLYAKGSIEGILRQCDISDEARQEIEKAHDRMAKQGMRMLALACKPLDSIQGRKRDEEGMGFLALLAFSDPVRQGVPESIKDCDAAGIRVMMLTGDHKATARAIAHSIGFSRIDHMEGSELAAVPKDGLARSIASHNVFSRVLPEQKLTIVSSLQEQGDTVAVTGDGVNDAPALKRADIGVAMGKRGTEVAREAAAIVLLDDNFVTIVKAIRQGRVIYDNLKKAFSYLVAFHVPIFLSAFVIPLLGMPLLLMPIHIIFLELFLHPVISIVFQREPAEADVMLRPPRKRDAPFIETKSVLRLVVEGTLLFLLCLLAYSSGMAKGETHARSLAFTLLIFGEAFLVAGELAGKGRASLSKLASNNSLLVAMLVTLVGWTILGSSSVAQTVFSIIPLTQNDVLIALLLSMIPFLVSETWKRIFH